MDGRTTLRFYGTADGSESTLTRTSKSARIYVIETRADLESGDWLDSGIDATPPRQSPTTALTLGAFHPR